jgi:3-deoxy-D-manno-octulosonic-acid transferase
VTAQTADYARRFVSLGVPGHRVRVTGSVKFDGLESDRNNEKTQQLRHLLALAPSDLVFVAGSTMEGEEEAVLKAYRAARRHHPRLRLVLVPRHAERFNTIAAWLQSQGERVIRRSEITSPVRQNSEIDSPILLVDTVGELAAVWGLADVAFVGGSLHRGRGGQNMMEPAAYGAAVMFGPHVSNFHDTVEQLLERNAARQIANSDELAYGLLQDLNDPESAAKRGTAGQSYVLAQNGASGRTVLELDRLVETSYAQPQH